MWTGGLREEWRRNGAGRRIKKSDAVVLELRWTERIKRGFLMYDMIHTTYIYNIVIVGRRPSPHLQST